MTGSKRKKDSVTYVRYHKMHAYCRDKNSTSYPTHGGIGVGICKRWYTYQNFVDDMGECPDIRASIVMLDLKKGYRPGNCIWGYI